MPRVGNPVRTNLEEITILPPMRILLLMILSIFVGEVLVMILLHLWPSLPVVPEALIDASVLVLVLSPTFYLFHYLLKKGLLLH